MHLIFVSEQHSSNKQKITWINLSINYQGNWLRRAKGSCKNKSRVLFQVKKNHYFRS